MHNKLCIPASGNTKRTVHIRFADMQADVCSRDLARIWKLPVLWEKLPVLLFWLKKIANAQSAWAFTAWGPGARLRARWGPGAKPLAGVQGAEPPEAYGL